jgi:DNA-binding HxlR family transcriptional regulator
MEFQRPGDVMLADCAARTTLELVAGTWTIVVVYALGKGPRRFSDLSALIGGISNKMLSQTLRKLERNGLIRRRAIAASPPGVEYRLTTLGESLLEPIEMLSRWSETHADDVVQAQEGAHTADVTEIDDLDGAADARQALADGLAKQVVRIR